MNDIFDDFDLMIQADELTTAELNAINQYYWEVENPADWEALDNNTEEKHEDSVLEEMYWEINNK